MAMRKHSLTFLILCAVAACVLTPAHRLTAQETDLRASNTPMEPVVPQVIAIAAQCQTALVTRLKPFSAFMRLPKAVNRCGPKPSE